MADDGIQTDIHVLCRYENEIKRTTPPENLPFISFS